MPDGGPHFFGARLLGLAPPFCEPNPIGNGLGGWAAREPCVVRQVEKTNAEMCLAISSACCGLCVTNAAGQE